MSTSDSDTLSSGSTAAVDPLSRSAQPAHSPARSRHSSYPRRQSSLSDARYLDHHPSPSSPIASGRDGSTPHLPPTINAQARRDILTAMDRKRRLTSSAQDHGRRRQGPMSLSDRTVEELVDSDEDLPSAAQASTSNRPQQPDVIDLTGSSPPAQRTPHRNRQQSRTSSSSSRMYVVPPWQPDSDVSECPICRRPFTWLFRRHHCRKCGRVVCNECSPHRITIPRQFIVNPPSPEEAASPTRLEGIRVETIDLTGDEYDDGDGPSSRYLGGGEKVRLCNPCVPDPQPEPLPNFPLSSDNLRPTSPTAAGSLAAFDGTRRHMNSSLFRPPSRHRTGTFPSFNPSTSLPASNPQALGFLGGRSRPSSMANPSMLPPGYDPRFGSHNVSMAPLIYFFN